MSRTLKFSRQRESIKSFLATRHDHPTADTVYINIKDQFPNISLGTVYRNLALLSEIGEITKITIGDGADRFDGAVHPHNHFICRNCHKVIDLKMDSIDHINEIARKDFSGTIEKHVAYFFGLCEDCTTKP